MSSQNAQPNPPPTPATYFCQKCNKTFTRQWILDRHLATSRKHRGLATPSAAAAATNDTVQEYAGDLDEDGTSSEDDGGKTGMDSRDNHSEDAGCTPEDTADDDAQHGETEHEGADDTDGDKHELALQDVSASLADKQPDHDTPAGTLLSDGEVNKGNTLHDDDARDPADHGALLAAHLAAHACADSADERDYGLPVYFQALQADNAILQTENGILERENAWLSRRVEEQEVVIEGDDSSSRGRAGG
ncbi:hypothetical protein GE09DRAFT_1220188 [Coniochaeta sp. 2T2.1]|nr:hypothetical protein GE09DRAFT_1220188 [Coniochaeta sp. 2T2.1]